MLSETSLEDRLVELWMHIRYFQKLGRPLLREAAACFSGGGTRQLEPEEVLFSPGDPADAVWIVLSGTLYEWCDDVRFAVRGPGTFVGTVAQASRSEHRTTEIQAMSPVRLLCVTPETLRKAVRVPGPPAMVLTAAVTQHVRRRTDAVGTAMAGLSWQVFGGRTALLPPSPWTVAMEVYAIPVKLPQALTEDLPPGVVPSSDGRAWLLVSFQRHLGPRYWPITGKHRRDSGFLSTAETELVVPVTAGGRQTLYAPVNFPNTLTALFLGREILGQPKMFGSTYRHDIVDEVPDLDPSDMRLVLRSAGRTAMRVHLQSVDDESIDHAAVLHLLQRLLPPSVQALDTHHVGITEEQYARQKEICASRLAEWRRLGRPPRFAFRRDGDPEEVGYWEGYLQGRMREVAAEMSGHETWGQALSAVSLVMRQVLRFVPPVMRTMGVASWRRTFASSAETTSGRHTWSPEDFEIDEVTESYRELQELRRVRAFRLQDQVIRLDAGRKSTTLELDGSFGLLVDLTVDTRAHAPTETGPVCLNYLASGDALPPDQRRRLDWGPQVWEEDLVVREVPLNAPLPPQPREDTGEPTVEQIRQERQLLDAVRKIAGPPRRWVAGTELFDVGDVGEHAWLIEEGVVEEWRESSLLGLRYADQLVGEVTVLAHGRRRTWQARAVTDLVLRRIEAEALRGLARDPQQHMGPALFSSTVRHAASGAQSATRDYQRMVYQFFPGNSGRTSPGPYQADDVDLFVIPCMRPPGGGLEQDMPPRVRWHPAMPMCWLLVARFTDFLPARVEVSDLLAANYTETGLMVPVLADGKFKLYYPFIHPSTLMAMFTGREVYGFAKSWRNTVIDEVNQRLVMRNRETTEMELFYEKSSWSDVGLREAMWSWWGLLRAMGQEGERPLAPPRSHHIPVLGPLEPFINAFCRGFPRLPERMRTLDVAGWMRVFDAKAQVPEETQRSGRIPWRPDLFDVDCMGGSQFLVNRIHSMSPVRLRDPQRLTLGNDDGSPPLILQPVATHAIRVHMSMSMLPQQISLDYRTMDLTAEDLERLSVSVH